MPLHHRRAWLTRAWIKPGMAAWEWWNDWGLRGVPFKAGINNETYRYFIDFAADNGIEYVVLDEGWYVPKSGDMLTTIPEIDLPALVEYADKKGVGLWLWTVFNVLDTQLEEACKKYSDLGIKGFKVDFLDRDDQTAVDMTYRIADATARHNLMLDLHGFYKPTGLNRTYPNVVNFESVFGMEEMKWSPTSVDMPEYDVTFPYIRMMCGPRWISHPARCAMPQRRIGRLSTIILRARAPAHIRWQTTSCRIPLSRCLQTPLQLSRQSGMYRFHNSHTHRL